MELARPLLCWCDWQRHAAEAFAARAGLQFYWLDKHSNSSLTQWRKQLMQAAHGWDAVLIWDELGLAMQVIEHPLPHPVRVDFLGGQMGWRSQHLSALRSELVAKACGVQKGKTPWVLDATAGLARDAWILAALGARVSLYERSPLVQQLLMQGLAAATDHPEANAVATRLQLHREDARDALAQWPLAQDHPEVIYLDPMFPHQDKSAKVKKEMLVFRSLVGADDDADDLLMLARAVAKQRVVVKRPRVAPDLAGQVPHQRLLGQSSRFDLYLPLSR